VAVVEPLDPRLRALASPVAGVHLWALDLTPGPDDDVAVLDAADRQRLATLPTEDARRLLTRRALVRTIVASLADCPPEVVRTSNGEGPRRVEGPDRGWYVSTSTCGGRGLFAVADVAVGVDLERDLGPPDAALVGRHLLAAAEHAWIDRGGPDAPHRFLEVWVRKEAVVKCTGEGLRRDLRSFVIDATASPAPVLNADGHPSVIRTYAVGYPCHVAALAVAARAHQ
jgi:4'-phosphopantetheinyl transferase